MQKMVPGDRIELSTPGFSDQCSTTELPRQKRTALSRTGSSATLRADGRLSCGARPPHFGRRPSRRGGEALSAQPKGYSNFLYPVGKGGGALGARTAGRAFRMDEWAYQRKPIVTG